MSRKRQAEIPNSNSGGTQRGAVEAEIQVIQVAIQATVQEEDGLGQTGPQHQEDHESHDIQDTPLFSSTLGL